MNEPSLDAIIHQHVVSGDPVLVMSASHDDYERGTNQARNRKLAAELRNFGLGCWVLHGHETGAAGQPTDRSEEECIFAHGTRRTDFKYLALRLIGEYRQAAALLKMNGAEGWLKVSPDGTTMELGPMAAESLAEAYGNHCMNRRAFVFDGVRSADGFMAGLARLAKERKSLNNGS